MTVTKKPYINRLQDENQALRDQLAEAEAAIREMQNYLLSSKFQGDGNDYVHVRTDMLPKLSSLRILVAQ
jgi:hypothetical protein